MSADGLARFPDTKELLVEQKISTDSQEKIRQANDSKKERVERDLSKKKALVSLLKEKGVKRGDFLFQNLREFMKVL